MTESAGHMRAGIAEIPALLAEPAYGDAPAAAAAALGDAVALDIVGCGTSLFAGMVLSRAFEYAGLRADTRQAFEYAAYPPPDRPGTALLAVSHTGHTPDVVAAADTARRSGRTVVAITDDADSPLAQAADAALVDDRGLEAAMAKTRSYAGTLVRGLLTVRAWAARRGSANTPADPVGVAGAATEVLARSRQQARELAFRFADVSRVVVVGGGAEHATACEAALKLTESAAVHADSWQIEEAAHGTWASTGAGELIVIIAPPAQRAASARILDGMRAIGATTWAVGADMGAASRADIATPTPDVHETLAPLLSVLPMYCFAEELGRARGFDPDIMRHDDERYRQARSVMRRSLPAR